MVEAIWPDRVDVSLRDYYLKIKLQKGANATKGAVTGKCVGYINFITDVTPFCDCWSSPGLPIVPDIEILASLDPVSIDSASFDLVNEASLGKFGKLHPSAEPEVQLNYAEQIGLGTRKYKLIRV